MTRTNAPRLWHYTCSHGHEGLGGAGTLHVGPGTIVGLGPLVWLTSDPSTSRHDLGLTSHTLDCDRMDHLYRTSGPHRAVPWASVRHQVPALVVRRLELRRDWSSWWVSRSPVRVRYVPKIGPASTGVTAAGRAGGAGSPASTP